MNINFSFKKLILLVLIGLLLWSVGAKYISLHEDIHQHIFSRYNINSTVSLNYFELSGTTTPTSYKNCNDSCKMQNTLNDIFGYYISLFIYFITILTLINWIFIKTFKKDE